MHLLVEWHLNALPPRKRLAALGLRHSLEHILAHGCRSPPLAVAHDEYGPNNFGSSVPGLWERTRLHNVSSASLAWDRTFERAGRIWDLAHGEA